LFLLFGSKSRRSGAWLGTFSSRLCKVLGRDFDVVDEEIVEVDGRRQVRASNHLTIDHELEVVSAGGQVYYREHAGSILSGRSVSTGTLVPFKDSHDRPRSVGFLPGWIWLG